MAVNGAPVFSGVHNVNGCVCGGSTMEISSKMLLWYIYRGEFARDDKLSRMICGYLLVLRPAGLAGREQHDNRIGSTMTLIPT